MQAAKFLYSKESSARPDEGEKACRFCSPDLSVISPLPFAQAGAAVSSYIPVNVFCDRVSCGCCQKARMQTIMVARHHNRTRMTENAHADNDLLIVRELRKMSSLSKRGERIAARTSDEDLKWLDWPDFVQVRGLCRTLAMTLCRTPSYAQDPLARRWYMNSGESALRSESISLLALRRLLLQNTEG